MVGQFYLIETHWYPLFKQTGSKGLAVRYVSMEANHDVYRVSASTVTDRNIPCILVVQRSTFNVQCLSLGPDRNHNNVLQ